MRRCRLDRHVLAGLLASTAQSRTGRVLGAVPSAAVMGARRIFPVGGKLEDAKKLTILLVVILETQVFTVTANAQNTLQHFQGASALKTFFFEGAHAVASLGWVTPEAATEGVTPLFFLEKTGDYT